MAEYALAMPVLILLLFGMALAGFYAFRAAAADWGVFITGVAEGAYETPATWPGALLDYLARYPKRHHHWKSASESSSAFANWPRGLASLGLWNHPDRGSARNILFSPMAFLSRPSGAGGSRVSASGVPVVLVGAPCQASSPNLACCDPRKPDMLERGQALRRFDDAQDRHCSGQALAETAIFSLMAVLLAFSLLAFIPQHRRAYGGYFCRLQLCSIRFPVPESGLGRLPGPGGGPEDIGRGLERHAGRSV